MARVDFAAKQGSVEDNVLKCIEIDGECLSEYRRLILTYWTFIDEAFKWDKDQQVFYIYRHRIVGLTSPESIDRAFRRLVKNKVLKLTREQEERREKMEEEYRIYHGKRRKEGYYQPGDPNYKEE